MRTVVFQSFRTHDVPEWINRCTASVREWAAGQAFEYKFIDDRLFDYVPDTYRAKITNKIILSDIARLLVSKELLGQGYQRTIWVDADILVFDPDNWQIPTEHDYYFCHEMMPVNKTPQGFQFDVRANNSVSVFSAGNQFQDFYIDSCRKILDQEQVSDHWGLGTHFLSWVRRAYPMPLMHNIGMFYPPLLKDIMRGSAEVMPWYIRAQKVPLVAANLCASLRDAPSPPATIIDDVNKIVVDRCLESKGHVVNQYLQG
ncbi:MAG TPA: hypothetical protein VGG44_00940 [Tepidisphaeraceae bacterium]|jgi:hypothetical protein